MVSHLSGLPFPSLSLSLKMFMKKLFVIEIFLLKIACYRKFFIKRNLLSKMFMKKLFVIEIFFVKNCLLSNIFYIKFFVMENVHEKIICYRNFLLKIACYRKFFIKKIIFHWKCLWKNYVLSKFSVKNKNMLIGILIK